MATHKITYSFSKDGVTKFTKTVETTDTFVVDIDGQAVAANQTNYELDPGAIDVSKIQSLAICVTGGNATLKTNNSATPDDTLSLIADEPVVWTADSPYTCPLTVDITTLFVTNTTAVTFYLYVLLER